MIFDAQSGFRERFFSARDGLRLYARDYGDDRTRLPVVCLPGLSRNSRDFHPLALALSTDPDGPRRVVALDYRGRGRSDRDGNKDNYALPVETGDVIDACAALGVTRAIFIGTSRGGLILHLLADLRPELIAATILNDIGPAIETAGLVEIRAYLSRRAPLASRADAVSALRQIHGADFPALSHDDWEEMADAIYTEREGRIVPDFDPALTAQLDAVDPDQPLPTLWPQFSLLCAMPMLAVRGENSRILSADTLRKMADIHPALCTLVVSGQGHAPILNHRDVLPVLRDFLGTL